MPLSLEQQLRKALDAEDIEKAKAISIKIEKRQKARTKPHVNVEPMPPIVNEPVNYTENIVDLTGNTVIPDETETSVTDVTQESSQHRIINNVHVGRGTQLARRESIVGKPHPNTWVDDKRQCANESQWDKKFAFPPVTRHRPPAQQYRIRCKGCGQIDVVYASQLSGRVGDEAMLYYCNQCCIVGH